MSISNLFAGLAGAAAAGAGALPFGRRSEESLSSNDLGGVKGLAGLHSSASFFFFFFFALLTLEEEESVAKAA
jgi:hypothetical protein